MCCYSHFFSILYYKSAFLLYFMQRKSNNNKGASQQDLHTIVRSLDPHWCGDGGILSCETLLDDCI